jgi:hypothetical protein
MRSLIVVIAVLFTVPAAAQVESRPTPAPIVTAENDSWYRAGQPVLFAGEDYYPSGPNVFFNGNSMVRSGDFNGVPLYVDTTVEPYSIVYVPIGRGLMKPYERPRRGDLEGTVGSRTPSFPVGSIGTRGAAATQAATPALAAPSPAGTAGADTPAAVGTTGRVDTAARGLTTVIRPRRNDGIWIAYDGAKWVSSGAAIPLASSHFTVVGEYAGFPVFAAADGSRPDVIYVPTREGLVAPYMRKRS